MISAHTCFAIAGAWVAISFVSGALLAWRGYVLNRMHGLI